MKSIIAVMGFCSSVVMAAPAPFTYESLSSAFDHASFATEQDLTGAFMGECYDSPKIITPKFKGNTDTVVLFGKAFPDGFHVGMFGHVLSGKGTSKRRENAAAAKYKVLKWAYESSLRNDIPVSSVSSGGAIESRLTGRSSYESEGHRLYSTVPVKYEYRIGSDGIISEVIQDYNGEKDVTVAVCHWFKKV